MITTWHRKRQEVIPAFVIVAYYKMIILLLGFFFKQFKIGYPELIALDLALHFCLADGIAESLLVMCIAMVIDTGAFHKISLALKPYSQLASVPFHLEHAGAAAGLQCQQRLGVVQHQFLLLFFLRKNTNTEQQSNQNNKCFFHLTVLKTLLHNSLSKHPTLANGLLHAF